MKEIPMPYIRTNQVVIVVFVALAIALQAPWLLIALWVVQAATLLWGLEVNVFVRLAKPFLQKAVKKGETEASELQRFNARLAVMLLTLSILALTTGQMTLGYVLAGMVAVAALLALCGFCVGCFLYFQLKQMKRK